MRISIPRFSVALGFAMAVVPAFALTITQDPDIATAQAAFGSAVTVLNWSDFFSSGTTWSFGALAPNLRAGCGTDPVTGNGVGGTSGTINLGNWIDGDGVNPAGIGFNGSSGVAAPDLAIDGPENFVLQFTNRVSTVGFAAATGLGNLPGEVDHSGAVFQVTTDTGEVGTLTLVDPGQGYAAWVTITADVPFKTLTFFEPSGNKDQYFGNILAKLATPFLTVVIDIRPHSYPNNINLRSQGVVPVAILGSSSFNVVDVDVNTVMFAGASPEKFVYEDVNSDGVIDLVFHFRTQELQLTSSSSQATLTGKLRGGLPFTGTDSVTIVPPKLKD